MINQKGKKNKKNKININQYSDLTLFYFCNQFFWFVLVFHTNNDSETLSKKMSWIKIMKSSVFPILGF